MILIIFILNLILADEIKLNFIDWNYDTKIEIDSLNIINPDYGIDTTLINPKSVDLKNLIIINSVELKNFGVVYNNNMLKITSKEVINHIEIIDLLGKKILNTSPNTNEFQKNINLNENLCFLILTIGNKIYSQKLYNVNQNSYQSPSILLSEKDKWQFTPYKENFRDTTYILNDDMLLSDSLDIELKRIRYRVSISTSPIKIKRHYYSFSMNPANCEVVEKKEDTFYERGFSTSMVIFETKINNHLISVSCPDSDYDFVYGFKQTNLGKNNSQEKGIEIKNNTLTKIINLNTSDYTDEFTDCEYSFFKYTLSQPFDFESNSLIQFDNEIEGHFYYVYNYVSRSGSYQETNITERIYNLKSSTTTISIKKLG